MSEQQEIQKLLNTIAILDRSISFQGKVLRENKKYLREEKKNNKEIREKNKNLRIERKILLETNAVLRNMNAKLEHENFDLLEIERELNDKLCYEQELTESLKNDIDELKNQILLIEIEKENSFTEFKYGG